MPLVHCGNELMFILIIFNIRWWPNSIIYTIPYVIDHPQNVTEMDLKYKNNVDHYVCNLSLGASHWLPLCGTGLLGWGWWISSHLSWTHIHHQDSISICRRSYQPQCVCNISFSCDSVHWESLFSAATGSNGSYFPGKYLYNVLIAEYILCLIFLPFCFLSSSLLSSLFILRHILIINCIYTSTWSSSSPCLQWGLPHVIIVMICLYDCW